MLGIQAHLPTRRLATTLALAATLGLLAAGCGGGGDGGSMSKDEVVAKVETACAKVNGYTVWLPEHLQKTHQTVDQGSVIVKRADEEFRSTLESLDPPDDLKKPLERLADNDPGSVSSPAELKAELTHTEGLYEAVGATRCAKAMHASILTVDGKSVEGAYHAVGLPLPPRPDGW